MKTSALGCVLVAMILAMAGARANPSAPGSRYAILSLIGDSMTIVTYSPSIGSRIDKNQQESVPLTDPVFDQAAAKAIDDALRRIGTRSAQCGTEGRSAAAPDRRRARARRAAACSSEEIIER